MNRTSIRVLVETAPKKTFVAALDWPGLARSGKDVGQAVTAFLAAVPRYAAVAREAGIVFDEDDVEIDVIERVPGNASTAFGVPAVIVEADRRATDEDEAARLAALVMRPGPCSTGSPPPRPRSCARAREAAAGTGRRSSAT